LEIEWPETPGFLSTASKENKFKKWKQNWGVHQDSGHA
jgi:hypothetical protein